jgi:hypothetical protein
MAFSLSTFHSVHLPSGRPGVFVYSTSDNLATVLAADYFNDAHDYVREGDLIQYVDNNGTENDGALLRVEDKSGTTTVEVRVIAGGRADFVAELTDSTGGTASTTLVTLTATYNSTLLLANTASLNAQINRVTDALIAAGLMADE